MILQAYVDFGFVADYIPLIIVAIQRPILCFVLIITKVEDPEELDTRFAKFAPGEANHFEEASELGSALPEGADNVLDIFRKLIERHLKEGSKEEKEEKAIALAHELDLTRLYFFPELDSVISVAHVLKDCYKGLNTLFRLKKDGCYCLVVRKSNHTPEEFNKISNILSEYGTHEKYASANEAYLEEHEELMIKDEALQKLALL